MPNPEFRRLAEEAWYPDEVINAVDTIASKQLARWLEIDEVISMALAFAERGQFRISYELQRDLGIPNDMLEKRGWQREFTTRCWNPPAKIT